MLVVLAPVRRARACGDGFYLSLLDNRGAALEALPAGTFVDEMARLVPKPEESFVVVEGGEEPQGARTGGGVQETELYQAGAQAYHAKDLEQARTRFHAVLELPAEERRRFGPFAAFMLGRMASSLSEAQLYFTQVRELVHTGSEDPLGLAVASLGEEARVLLREGEDRQALQRYAEQASHGSASGAVSLLWVTRAVARDEARLQQALQSPLGQRLLATYVWTHPHDSWWSEDTNAQQQPLPGLLEKLAAVPQLAGADRLAAAAWRAGRFDLAERFAGKQKSALDTWVRAKLQLRQGHKAEADKLLAETAAQFDPATVLDGVPGWPARRLVEGERGVLALTQGQFGPATEHLLASCIWPDIAYMAESVLTLEELRKLVTTRPDALKSCSQGEEEPLDKPLRALLARRLLRSGKGQESLAFFQGTPEEKPARKYVEALAKGRAPGDASQRARALYEASVLARNSGLELMSTALAPDEGQDLMGSDENKALMTPEELKRREAHQPPHPTVRHHYRSTAADLAEEAAALVHPRSQAYAALLCQAARFVSQSEPERATQLWKTYVRKGAFLKGSWVFGRQCPEPDFDRPMPKVAARPPPSTRWRKRNVVAVAGVVLLPVVVVGVQLLRRKKSRPEQTS